MEKMAQEQELDIVVMKKESHSAKEAGQRPVFNEIVEEIKQGKFDGILTWAPDRISRNAGDLGKIVDLMDQGLLKEIRTYGGQKFSNNPNEKFLLMILGSQLESNKKLKMRLSDTNDSNPDCLARSRRLSRRLISTSEIMQNIFCEMARQLRSEKFLTA